MTTERGRSLHVTERKLLLSTVDAVLVVAAVVVGLWRWSDWDPTRELDTAVYLFSFALVPLWWGAGALTGAYDLRVATAPWRIVRSVFFAAALLLGLYIAIYFAAPRAALPRAVVMLQLALAAGAIAAWRVGYASVFGRARFRRRVLVVGGGRSGVAIADTLTRYGVPTFEIVGILDDETSVERREAHRYPIVGATTGLLDAARTQRVSEVVVAVDEPLGPELLGDLLAVQEQGIQVTPMPLMHEALTGQVPVEYLGDNWWGTLPLDHPQTRVGYSVAKRVFDLAIALPSLVVFAAMLPFLAAAIKLDSRGRVFYRQARLGRYGQSFKIVKLRTMVSDAEPEGKAVWATEGDPRITRVGRLLRATMLDEIPQLYNVLKGEMSIVGPRPERPELVAALEKEIPFYRLRHAASPGMAGWSLLHEGYGRSAQNALAKLQYDLYYIKHQSLWLDVQIVLRTLGRGLSFRRAERTRASDQPTL